MKRFSCYRTRCLLAVLLVLQVSSVFGDVDRRSISVSFFLPSLLLDLSAWEFLTTKVTIVALAWLWSQTRPLIIANADSDRSGADDDQRPRATLCTKHTTRDDPTQHGNDQRERCGPALDQLHLQWHAEQRRSRRRTPSVRSISFPLVSPFSLTPGAWRIPRRTHVAFQR